MHTATIDPLQPSNKISGRGQKPSVRAMTGATSATASAHVAKIRMNGVIGSTTAASGTTSNRGAWDRAAGDGCNVSKSCIRLSDAELP